ncbi:MAG: Trk system potassium transporter TrkA [Solobacterium sp.]|nr:Trk system potassium transporter TrkA [Solobacterium sp.]
MRILIAGAGKVGRALTDELSSEGHDITLVDMDSRVLEDAVGMYDVITLQGNSASKAVLEEAGIQNMDLLIAATNADEVNLLSVITAKALNPDIHTIARIRNPEYVDQARSMRNVFALSLVINPELQAAQEIARLLKYPGFLKRETFAKARVEIVELKVVKGSKLNKVQLKNLSSVTRSQVLVVAALRDGKAIMPDGNFVIKEDDRLFVTGSPAQLHEMLIHIGIINMPVNHVIMAGGGRISYYLAEELHRSHIATSIIELDPRKCRSLAEALPYSTIIQGDVSDRKTLDSEDIGDYDAVVTLTGMDELNIVTSLYAHMHNVPNIVTKLGRGNDGDLVENMPIGSIICPKELCTMHIVRYVRAMQTKEGAALSVHRIADGKIEAIEFVADNDTRHLGEKLKNIRTRKNVLIVSISHGTKVEIANGESVFNAGDTVVVITNKESKLNQLNDIFEDSLS